VKTMTSEREKWRARYWFFIGAALFFAWADDLWRVRWVGLTVAALLFVGWIYSTYRMTSADADTADLTRGTE
jgi:hypothetical protein